MFNHKSSPHGSVLQHQYRLLFDGFDKVYLLLRELNSDQSTNFRGGEGELREAFSALYHYRHNGQWYMAGIYVYSVFIQSAVQLMLPIQSLTHILTYQRRSAAMQGTNQLVRSNPGLGVLLQNTVTFGVRNQMQTGIRQNCGHLFRQKSKAR